MYRELIINHARHPRCFGALASPTFTISSSNPSCGDRLDLDVCLGEDGTVVEAAFRGTGCAISMAGASLLLESLSGKAADDVSKATLATMEGLLGITVAPMRVRCATLALSALQQGIDLWKVGSTSKM